MASITSSCRSPISTSRRSRSSGSACAWRRAGALPTVSPIACCSSRPREPVRGRSLLGRRPRRSCQERIRSPHPRRHVRAHRSGLTGQPGRQPAGGVVQHVLLRSARPGRRGGPSPRRRIRRDRPGDWYSPRHPHGADFRRSAIWSDAPAPRVRIGESHPAPGPRYFRARGASHRAGPLALGGHDHARPRVAHLLVALMLLSVIALRVAIGVGQPIVPAMRRCSSGSPASSGVVAHPRRALGGGHPPVPEASRHPRLHPRSRVPRTGFKSPGSRFMIRSSRVEGALQRRLPYGPGRRPAASPCHVGGGQRWRSSTSAL
jgi:hypothetical protein